jgi:hypothetical protein
VVRRPILTAVPEPSATPARRALDDAASRPATLGGGRLICVDGPAGSGKTTLAAEIHARAPAAQLVHTDDLLEGWDGLPGLAGSLASLLRPLATGRPGRWRRWDWHADGWAGWHSVTPGPLLVLEGVGSWSPAYADLVTLLVWVEADPAVRRARGLARDGEALAPHWERWSRAEDRLHARDATREHADLVVSGEERPG